MRKTVKLWIGSQSTDEIFLALVCFAGVQNEEKREVKTAAAREYLCRQINFEIIGAFCVKLHDMAKDETQKVERGGCPIIQNL